MKNKRGKCGIDGVCWALEGRMEMQGWSDYGFWEIVEINPITSERKLSNIAYYSPAGSNNGAHIYVKYCLFCGGMLGKDAVRVANAKNNTAQCDIDDVCNALATQIEYERFSDYGFEKISDKQAFVGVVYRSETDSEGTDIYISHCPFCGGRPGVIANKNATAKEEAENGSN